VARPRNGRVRAPRQRYGNRIRRDRILSGDGRRFHTRHPAELVCYRCRPRREKKRVSANRVGPLCGQTDASLVLL
jgi:hypothetical protein